MANGLKKMVANRTGNSKPTHKCDNCGCVRYNPCKCMKKQKKEAQEAKEVAQEQPSQ